MGENRRKWWGQWRKMVGTQKGKGGRKWGQAKRGDKRGKGWEKVGIKEGEA